MPASVWSPEIQSALSEAVDQAQAARREQPGGRPALAVAGVARPAPFPSPIDWRDVWIYQVVLDRFNNPAAAPRQPWNRAFAGFMGGTFNGLREQLDYLQELGVGALWLSPVQKNCQYFDDTYHGYGIQDFVAIDPRYASDPTAAREDPGLAEQELRALVDAAHSRGLYVIFDIVLHHCGDIFGYDGFANGLHSEAPRRTDGDTYGIHWRDADGHPRPDWANAPDGPDVAPDAAVGPAEFRRNACFTRKGVGDETGGDFASLKELNTNLFEFSPDHGNYYPVRGSLIRAYQYLIARYDCDGFRIDTLKYIDPQFALEFGNAIREYGYSIGKKNFFTFGEVYDDDEKIARFIGRNTSNPSDLVGVDAALDFPLFFRLPSVAKGFSAPSELAGLYSHRKAVEADLLSSHGEASKFFVTFLDNHDQRSRFYHPDLAHPHDYDNQITLGLACLFGLQGIPCVYYGTEQGLRGTDDIFGPNVNWDQVPLEAVREPLWGKPGTPFDRQHPFFRALARLAQLRQDLPALRYGRQYFRPISGDHAGFGVSPFRNGVVAFSRILNGAEVLVVANTSTTDGWAGDAIVDYALNPVGTKYAVRWSNQDQPAAPGAIAERSQGVTIFEASGAITHGPVRVLPVNLKPMEAQVLARNA